MLNLSTATPEQVAQVKSAAALHFGPLLLQEALARLGEACGHAALDKFEKDVTRHIEAMRDDQANFELMKDFAVEQLLLVLRNLKKSPDMKQPLEKIEARRTEGRSEVPETLEDQLQEALEDSFPASDPPAVTSTTIAGRSKNVAGGEENERRGNRHKEVTE
jgi:hypothetical protein